MAQQKEDTLWEDNPDNDDYPQMAKRLLAIKEQYKTKPDRYQSINVREDRSDLSIESIKSECTGKYFMTHKGCPLMKCPNDLVVFQEMFCDLRPKTIIQLGTFTGGTAIWMADILTILDIQAHIYSTDIDLSMITPQTKAITPSNVTFLQSDSNEIEKTFTEDLLKTLPHPWIIIEDAHVNIYGIMEYFHGYMQEGDYFIIEDLNPDLPAKPVYSEIIPKNTMKPYVKFGTSRLEILKKFLIEYDEYYCVDSFYTDFFGYNATWHWNGFIRKMK